MKDTFQNKTNRLSNFFTPSLASNFSFEVELQQSDDMGQLIFATKVYAGANGSDSYVLVTDMAGQPYLFSNRNMTLIAEEGSPEGKFSAYFEGFHNYYCGRDEENNFAYFLQIDNGEIIKTNRVTVNFSEILFYAGSRSKKAVFTAANETIYHDLGEGKELHLSFVKGPFVDGAAPGNPTGINEVKLIGKQSKLTIKNLRFDAQRNAKRLSFSRADLEKSRLPFKQIDMPHLKAIGFVPFFPHKYKWSEPGKQTSAQLRALLEE